MRPESLEFPQIFYKFEAKDKDSDEVIEYRVQDLPEELYESAIELYAKEFFPDEIMCSSKKLPEREFSQNELITFWRDALKKRLTIACFRNNGENDDELVAVNVLVVHTKDDDHDLSHQLKDQGIKDVLEAIGYTFEQAKIYEKYGIDKYVSAYGLIVNRKYRGRGIATEMLKARKPILEAIGMTVTSTAFTGLPSQKAAANAGYVEDYVISYDDLAKVSPGFLFEKGLSKPYKIMTLKI